MMMTMVSGGDGVDGDGGGGDDDDAGILSKYIVMPSTTTKMFSLIYHLSPSQPHKHTQHYDNYLSTLGP